MNNAPVRSLGPEREVWKGHPSWKGMIGWYVKWEGLALAISVLIIWLWSAGHAPFGWVFLTVLVVNGLALGIGHITRRMTTYEISSLRIRDVRRVPSQLFRLQMDDAPISRINDYKIQQSLWQQMLGIGTIDFDTAGEKAGDIFVWWGVSKPRDVASKIENVMQGTWDAVDDEDEPSRAPYFHADPSQAPQGYIERDEDH